jgi:hypothetical protein
MLGIYGNTKDEAIYGSQQTGADGKLRDGNKDWVLRFEPGKLPPVKQFWSITMYKLPERFLVDNALNRYSIGDRTPGLKMGADGSLEIHMQADNPGPDKNSNWLPAPKGPFFLVGRFYGPKQEALDGTWNLPPLSETWPWTHKIWATVAPALTQQQADEAQRSSHALVTLSGNSGWGKAR